MKGKRHKMQVKVLCAQSVSRKNPGQGRRMGAAARARAERHFERGAMVRAYEALFVRLAGGRS